MIPKRTTLNKSSHGIKQKSKLSRRSLIMMGTAAFLCIIAISTVIFFLTGNKNAHAAVTGDYRSAASGNWNLAGTWEKFNGKSWIPAIKFPESRDGTITIQAGHSITVTGNVTIDQAIVCPGALLLTSEGTLTLANGAGTDLIVNGTLGINSTFTMNASSTILLTGLGVCRSAGNISIGPAGASITIDSGGVFRKDGGIITTTLNAWIVNSGGKFCNNDGLAFPLAMWKPGSTCELTKTTSVLPANLNQPYSNFNWNCTTQSMPLNFAGTFQTVNGDLTISSTGTSFIQLDLQGNNTTLNIGRNLYVYGGTIYGCMNGVTNVNVSKNYKQTGGSFIFNMAGGTAYGNTSMIMNVLGNINISGGIFDLSQCNANNFAKGNGVLNLKGNLALSGTGLMTETSGFSRGQVYFNGATVQYFTSSNSVTRKVDFNVNPGAILRMDDQILTGNGNFTLSAGGGLMMGHAKGITISGLKGNIQVTGIRSYNIGGDYTYNGLVLQNSGNGLPYQVRNFRIDNSRNLYLTNSTSVSNILTFNSGLVIATRDTLTLGISPTIRGTLIRNSGHVVGFFKRWIAAAATNNILFPIGNLNYYNGANFSFTTAPVAGSIVSNFIPLNNGSLGLPLTDAGELCYNVGYSYWLFVSMNGFSGGVYDVNLFANGFPGVNDFTKLHILRRVRNGSPWIINGTHSPGAGTNISPVANRTAMNLLGHYGIVGTAVNPLPIELIYFDAKSNGKQVNLSWVTASEINNDYFTVERSSDAINFEELLRKPGSGNTTNRIHYSSTDFSPLSGFSYYKLKQTDYDGQSTYSEIVAVKINPNDENNGLQIVSVGPTNFTDKFTVIYYSIPETEVDFHLVNASGQVVFKDKIMSNDKLNMYDFVDKKDLAKGVYFINLFSDDQKQVQKIIKS